MANANVRRFEIIESNPIARAVLDFMKTRRRWRGSATALLERLVAEDPSLAVSKGFPKDPNQLSRRLVVVQSTLIDVGYSVEIGKRDEKRFITLEKAEPTRKTGKA